MDNIDPWKLQLCQKGRKVLCTVKTVNPGQRYRVIIAVNSLYAELDSTTSYEIGDELVAEVVELQGDRIILSDKGDEREYPR